MSDFTISLRLRACDSVMLFSCLPIELLLSHISYKSCNAIRNRDISSGSLNSAGAQDAGPAVALLDANANANSSMPVDAAK